MKPDKGVLYAWAINPSFVSMGPGGGGVVSTCKYYSSMGPGEGGGRGQHL